MIGPAFVIEIVEQCGKAPAFFVGTGFARVGADTCFHGKHVLA